MDTGENLPNYNITKILPKSGTLGTTKTHLLKYRDDEAYSKRISLNCYKKFYKDLATFSDQQLLQHWKKYGFKEGRLPTLGEFITKKLGGGKKTHEYLANIWLYREANKDLDRLGFDDVDLVKHYFRWGAKEGRCFLPEGMLAKQGVLKTSVVDKCLGILKDIPSYQEKNGDLLDILLGNRAVPFEFYRGEPEKTAQLYLDLATEMLKFNKKNQGKNLLLNSIYYGESSKAYELLGNLQYDDNENAKAKSCFENAIKLGTAGEGAYKNLSITHSAREQHFESMTVLLEGLKGSNGHTKLLVSCFLSATGDYYNQTSACLDELNNINSSNNAIELRNKMVSLADQRTKILFDAWLGFYTHSPVDFSSKHKKNNFSKVLIVGDYHVEQCVRYRINQKIEQLSAAGNHAHAIDHLSLDKPTKLHLPLYDVIIFYRVPATNVAVKLLAMAKALEKLVIYEIDDQIFQPIYPASISSYGGSVDLHTYQGLSKGMALNHAFISLCDYAIGSTKPLTRMMNELVISGEGYVHRNGLDMLSKLHSKPHSKKNNMVTIFYGTGTLAHNSDFIDIALPAISEILTKYPSTQLVVVGHLKLPQQFCRKFGDRCRLIPKVSVEAYLAYLSKADINLAVLHDDIINGAKSELKWFEAACFEIPSILSSTQNYRDVIKHGEDAFLVDSSEGWFKYLDLLVANKEIRDKVGKAAQRRIEKEYSPEVLGKKLSDHIRLLTQKNSPPTKKPKICLVNVYFPPQSIGGATRVVADNFDVLVEQYSEQFEICVFTSERNHSDPYQVSAYNYKGVRVYKSSIQFRKNMDWHAKDPNMYEIFREFLGLEKPDKVHFHCVQRLSASIVEATRDISIPYIVTAHDAWWISDYQFLVDQDGKVYPEGHPDSFAPRVLPNNVTLGQSLERDEYLKGLLHDAETVLAVSESFADIYKKNGITNISVTKNGISSSIDWKEKNTNYTKKVVCALIGGMSKHKGFDIFKEALTDSQPTNIEALIVDHSQKEDFENTVYWGNVPVTIIGQQPQENIVDLYQKIDILFAPSIWPESFGLVTREAAACGCWVVASHLGGIGEDVEDKVNGFVIEPCVKALSDIFREIDKEHLTYKESPAKQNMPEVGSQVKLLAEYYSTGTHQET